MKRQIWRRWADSVSVRRARNECEAVQWRRLFRACSALALTLGVVVLVEPIANAFGFGMGEPSFAVIEDGAGPKASESLETLDEQGRADALRMVLDAAEDGGSAPLEKAGLLRFGIEDVPDPVRDEVLFAFGCDCVTAVPGFSVFGIPGYDAAAKDSWRLALAQVGWMEVRSDNDSASTFAKDKGGCRWLMVQPTGTGDAAMAVATLSWTLEN